MNNPILIEMKMTIISYLVEEFIYPPNEFVDEFMLHLTDYLFYLYDGADYYRMIKLRNYCLYSSSIKQSKYFAVFIELLNFLLSNQFKAI